MICIDFFYFQALKNKIKSEQVSDSLDELQRLVWAKLVKQVD